MDKLFSLNEKYFFEHVVLGKSYNYSMNEYLFQDVEIVASKYGVKIKYNQGGTPVYTRIGCFNFTVTSVRKKVIIKPQYFDPKNLLNEVNEWRNIRILKGT